MASVLRLRDPKTGNWVEVPALKGTSAYESAQEGGYTGTEEQFYKDLALIPIEDETYKGCYYRTVNGVREWINPPMITGVEYRTTERYEGYPVYVKVVDVGELPVNSDNNYRFVDTSTSVQSVVRLEGKAVETSTGRVRWFPVTTTSGILAHASVFSNSVIYVYTSEGIQGYTGTFTVYYTKVDQ